MNERLSNFKTAYDNLKTAIPLSDESYNFDYLHYDKARKYTDYSREEIEEIILSGEPEELRLLSLNFYYSSGIYRNFITYFSNLLTYSYLLIPNIKPDKKINKIAPIFEDCQKLVDNFGVETKFADIFNRVLIEGGVYGIIKFDEKNSVANLQFLPFLYSRSRFATLWGIDIVEFNVEYFDSHIFTEESRKKALANFPSYVRKAYYAWTLGKIDKWIPIPVGEGFHFKMFEERPFFINVIPSILSYDDYQDIDKRKQAQDLSRVLVHELPTYQDQLVIDPQEGEVIHQGVVQMLGNHNPDMDVITTWGTAHIEQAKDADGRLNESVARAAKVVYAEAGLSDQLFAAEGNIALGHSLEKDLSNAMYLANKVATWFSCVLNLKFATKSVNFTFKILPISQYNRSEMFKIALQGAQAGYSFLIPALCEGFRQSELGNVKVLENEILGLGSLMQPLKSSYTSSSKDITNEGGREPENQTDLNDRTLDNKESE